MHCRLQSTNLGIVFLQGSVSFPSILFLLLLVVRVAKTTGENHDVVMLRDQYLQLAACRAERGGRADLQSSDERRGLERDYYYDITLGLWDTRTPPPAT